MWPGAGGESALLFLLVPRPVMGLGLKALCRYILTTWLTAALALLTLDSATVASPAGASLVVIYLFIYFCWCQFLGRPRKRGPAETCYVFTCASRNE